MDNTQQMCVAEMETSENLCCWNWGTVKIATNVLRLGHAMLKI